jgi:nucleoside phosphorylase
MLEAPRRTGKKNDPNIYNVGTVSVDENKKGLRAVVLATQSDMGKSNAAVVGANAMRSFPNLRHIIMVGIGGGCPNPNNPEEHVRLGDIVVSDARGVIEYDDIKQTKERREYRGPPRAPSYELLQAATQLGTAAIAGLFPWEKYMERGLSKLHDYERPDGAKDVLYEGDLRIEHPLDPERQRRPGWPRVHRGAVATADTLLKASALRDELRDRFGVRAIEMEGSGLQTAAWAQGKDIMVVRGICDYCDDHKDNTWQKYAALAAAAYARALIEVLPDAWFT